MRENCWDFCLTPPNQQPISSMSQARHRDLEGGNSPDFFNNRTWPPPAPAPNRPPQKSAFSDSSGPLFSMYSEIAEEEDEEMAKRWQKDADALLIFTGLFSAAVAALLAVSVQDLRPDSQNISAFYLENIYLLLVDLNVPPIRIPSSVARPPPFSPPRYAIWVNSLWFLSLSISLTCALLATSLHQWARRYIYIRVTRPVRHSPEKRARMRAFFADGVDELHVPRVVEGLPALLHLSLFLFFCGLVIFLFNINHAIYSVVMLWIAIFTTVYVWITLMPILRHDSPYYTPLSTSAWFLYSNTLFHLRSLFRKLRDRYRGWISGGVEKAAEEATSKRSSEIDIRILDWTLGALREDDTLEKFFAAIPGLFKSKLVKDLETHFTFALYARFWEALDGFLERTLSSNSVQDSIKTHRLVISTNIMQLIPSPLPGENFPSGTLSNTFNRIPPSIRMGQVLARWCDNHDERISERARIGIVGILMSVEERDDRWVALAESQLRLSKRALENYVAHGDDSISLAILTHVTRQAIRSNPRIWLDQLSFLTRFNILNTHPELQNDFCASWNQTVLEARKRGYNSNPVEMLYEIHHHYIALHQGTDADLTAFTASTDDFHILWEPSSYPLCNIPSHRAHSFAPSRTHVPRALSALSPTSVGHYFDVPPHLTVSEPQPTLATGSTTGVRHAEEPDIIPGLRSTDELSSSPRSTSLHPTTQVTSTGPSVPESIEAISQDPNDAPFNRPTAHVHTGETVESSHVPTDIPLPFPQPNLVLTPVIPSAGPYIPSFPVPDTRGAPDLLQYFSFVPNTASSSGRQHQQEVAPPWVARDVSGIPFMGGSLPRSISSGEATLGTNNESTVVPPVVSGSPPSLIPLALHDGVIPIEPSSSSGAGSDLIQADHPFHTQGPQFSSPITVPRLSHTPPHVTFVQDTHVPMRVGTVTGNDDTDDASIEMEVFSLQLGTQRVPLGARNVSSISPLEDRKYSPENL